MLIAWGGIGLYPLFEMSPVLTAINYDHNKHAGNIGDLTKHIFLSTLLSELWKREYKDKSKTFTYLDTHSAGVKATVGKSRKGFIQSFEGSNLASPYLYAAGVLQVENGYYSSWAQVAKLAAVHGVPIRMTAMDIVKDVVEWNKSVAGHHINFVNASGWKEAALNGSNYSFIFIDPPYKDFGVEKSKSIPQDWKRVRVLLEHMRRNNMRGLIWMPYYTESSAKKAGVQNIPLISVYDGRVHLDKPNSYGGLNQVIKGSSFYAPGFTVDQLEDVVYCIKRDAAFARLGNGMKIEMVINNR